MIIKEVSPRESDYEALHHHIVTGCVCVCCVRAESEAPVHSRVGRAVQDMRRQGFGFPLRRALM